MIIRSSTGVLLYDILIAEAAQFEQELMKSDQVTLSWNSDENTVIPVGAYIEYKGEKYSLLDPYTPVQKNEVEWAYTPVFKSETMRWGKVPFFFYTYNSDNAITGRETDWVLTDTPANFMAKVCESIKNETGAVWTYSVDASLAASMTITYSSVDIFSALNSIANAFETEWWVDKTNKVLHLSKASFGEAVLLEVDSNIGVPTVQSQNGKEYYNRFYAFGSTRNIPQEYSGANVNNLTNRRLTLDPAVYPGGYKDTVEGLTPQTALSKILVFDDIYPHSDLEISDVRARLRYVLDENGNKVQVGTDDDGNPVYDQYTIWYFKISGFTFNNTTYDAESNPNGMLLPGLTLSVHFRSGALTGREFELAYHDAEEVKNDSADVTPFTVEAGDYEILYIKEGSYIIPAQTGIVPADGDDVTLFNIKMPDSYNATAYEELEDALDEAIAEYASDLNSYTSKSNPVAFNASDPGLVVGRNVTYKNGSYTLSTRVTKIIKKLDYECEQTITFGNSVVKGSTQELKEDVVLANRNIDILTQLNQLSNQLTQSYNRVQQSMIEGFARIGNMWKFDPDDPDNTIYTPFNVYSNKEISAGGKSGGGDVPAGVTKLSALEDVSLSDLAAGQVLKYDGSKWVNAEEAGGISSLTINLGTVSYEGVGTTDVVVNLPAYPTSMAWGSITGKPTYYPADIENINGLNASWETLLQSAPAAYVTRWPAWGEITGKPSWIGSTKPSYAFSEITGKPTTISGYGITDAYTKQTVDDKIAALQSAINAINSWFTLSDGTLITTYNIAADGEVSAGGQSSGGGGGTGGLIQTVYGYSSLGGTFSDNNKNDTFNAYTINTLASRIGVLENTPSGISSLTVNVGTVSYVGTGTTDVTVNLPAYPTTLPASDVYAWAKQPNKPSYTFSEIGSKPSTLSGYGITDAYSKTDADNRYLQLSGGTMSGDITMTGHALVWGQTIIDWNTVRGGLRLLHSVTSESNAGTTYCVGIHVDTGYRFQLASSGGGNNSLHYRGYNGNTSSWDAWVQLLHTGNIGSFALTPSNYTSTLDSRYARTAYDNNLIYHGNEFNFIPSNYNDSIWINYRTQGGRNGNVPEYGFYNGSGQLSNILASTVTANAVLNTPSVQVYDNISTKANRLSLNWSGGVARIYAISNDGNSLQDLIIGRSSMADGALYFDASTKRWGIGTASPTEMLHVVSSMRCDGWYYTYGAYGWYNSTYGGGWYMTDSTYIRAYNGKALYVANNIVATGEVSAGNASDRRLKKDISTLSEGETEHVLSALNPVSFVWNAKAEELSNGRKRGIAYSFVADEFLSLLPNAGRKMWDEYDAIYTEQVVPYVVKGWQMHERRLSDHERRIQELEKENKELKRQLRRVA